MKHDYYFLNQVTTEFWFCSNNINTCVKGSKKRFVFDWLTVPTTWPVKIGTYFSREVFALEDVGCQL